jgi:hypothetical protein
LPTSAIDADRPYAPDGATWRPGSLDAGFGLCLDEPMMAACCGLIVAKLEGWDCSHGVRYEIAMFGTMGKPIAYLDVDV